MKTIKNQLVKSIAVLSVMIFITASVQAQKVIEFGVRYMPTISSFDVKTSSGGTVKGEATLGYGVGAFLGVNFSKHLGVQAEVIYTSINQKYTDQDVSREINLKYINIPLLLSFNTDKSAPVNLNIVAGPQIGLSTGSSIKSTGGDGTVTSQAVLSVKKNDLGIAYGLGVDFGLNPGKTFRLGLGYRGVLGLVDISDNSETTTTDQFYVVSKTHIKTNAGYIGISFIF